MNIIGDIAGNYKTLVALLNQMPKGNFIALGDMIDRGPRSKEVLEFIMNHGQAVLGNHEHILLDKLDAESRIFNGNNKTSPYYRDSMWFNNGGLATMESFFPGFESLYIANYYNVKITGIIDQKYIDWLKSLPYYLDLPDCFLSHAPRHPKIVLNQAQDLGKGFYFPFNNIDFKSDTSLLWHRGDPAPIDKIQIYGHNSYPSVLYHTVAQPQGVIKESLDGSEVFAIGIDTSFSRVLTGIHLPTRQIYQQPYID